MVIDTTGIRQPRLLRTIEVHLKEVHQVQVCEGYLVFVRNGLTVGTGAWIYGGEVVIGNRRVSGGIVDHSKTLSQQTLEALSYVVPRVMAIETTDPDERADAEDPILRRGHEIAGHPGVAYNADGEDRYAEFDAEIARLLHQQ
jgi:hypothetical protein